MRSFVLAACAVTAPLTAQNWYVPNSSPIGTGCNVIPFGQTQGGPFYQSKYQIKASQADLGGLPGVITGLGFTGYELALEYLAKQ